MQYTWLLVIIYGGKARYYGGWGGGANHWSKLWRFYFIVLGLNEIPWYLVWKKWYKAIKSIKMYVKIRLFMYNFKSPNLNGTINLELPPSSTKPCLPLLSQSLCHSVSVSRILISVCCIFFLFTFHGLTNQNSKYISL